MSRRTPRRRLIAVGAVLASLGSSLLVFGSVQGASAAGTHTWVDNGTGSGNWTTASNWDAAGPPVPGEDDDLVFPDHGDANQQALHDFPAGSSYGTLTVQDSGYTFSGQRIVLDAITTTHASGQVNIAFTDGNTDTGIDVPAGGLDYTIGAGGEVSNGGQIQIHGNTVDLAVDGSLINFFGFVETAAGATVNRTGSGVVNFTQSTGASVTPPVAWNQTSGTTRFNSASYSAIVTQSGGRFEGHQGFVNGYVGNGGILAPGTVVNGNLNENGTLNFRAFDMNAGGTLEFDINSSQAFDQINVTADTQGDPNACANNINGPVDLDGTLDIDATGFVPLAGSTITIISNDCSEAITGTFDNLPQGDSVNVGGVQMVADYSGGTNNNDLVLTAPAGNVFTWDGSSSGDWATAANWEGNAAPVGNGTETLVFPNGPVTQTMNHNVAGSNFVDLVFTGFNYVINGNRINLSGGIQSQVNAANTINSAIEFVDGGYVQMPGQGGGGIVFGGPVSPDEETLAVTGGTISLSNTAPAVNGQLDGDLDSANPGTVDLSGAGGIQVLVDQAGNFTGGTIVVQANNSNQGISLAGSLPGTFVTMHGGAMFGGGETIGDLTADGGQISPSAPQSSAPGTITTGNLALSGNAYYQWEAEAATGDQLNVVGTVSLGNALFSASQTFNNIPITATSFTIVNNDGADPVSGIFRFDPPPANSTPDPTPPVPLPEGGLVVVNGLPFTITYAGGTGNDVVLQIANADVWDGSASNLWSNDANWVDGSAPTSGANLVFPETAANKSNSNDIVGLSVAGITLSGPTGGYTLAGNAITVAGDISSANSSGTNVVSLSMTLTGGGALTTVSGGIFTSSGAIDLGGGALDLRGQGNVNLSGTYTNGELDIDFTTGGGFAILTTAQVALSGGVDVDEGTLLVNSVSVGPGSLRVHPGGSLSMGGGTAPGGIVTDGGSLAPGSQFDTTQVLTVGPPGNLALGGGGFTAFDIDAAAAASRDVIAVNGTVALGGFLSISSQNVPAVVGQTFVIIDNDGTDPVTGTFAGVPEGGTVNMGGGPTEATISYVGGTGNDVTATISSVFTWTGGAGPGSPQFSNVGNWQGGVAPTGLLAAHETLVFPTAGATNFTATNDTPGFFDNIRVSGNTQYLIGGAALTLSGGITSLSGTAAHTVSAPVVLSGGGSITGEAVGVLTITGAITAGADDLLLNGSGGSAVGLVTADEIIKQGIGTATLTSALATVGDLVLDAGQLVVNDTVTAPIDIDGGALQGDGTVGGITGDGGTIEPGGAGHAVLSSSADANPGATSLTADVNGNTAGTNHDRLAVNGTATLSGPLVVRSAAALPIGTQSVILTATTLSGTFTGLAEGANFVGGANSFTISYAGNQVTLTVAAPAPPVASLNDDAVTILEGDAGDTSAGLSVLLSSPAPANTTVHVTATAGTGTPGTDTDSLDLELPVTQGQTSAAIPFDVIGDNDAEVDETVTVTLTVPSGDATLGSPSVATVTIDDDDPSTVSVVDPVVQITEGGVAAAGVDAAATSQLTLTLDGPSEVPIDVDIETADVTATAPADYAPIDGFTTIPAGVTSVDVPISVVADLVDEPDETFLVRLLSATGGSLTPQDITVTILDDDVAQIVTTTSTTAGGGGTTTATTARAGAGSLTRTGAESGPMTWMGFGLVLFGGGLVLAGRRRRLTA